MTQSEKEIVEAIKEYSSFEDDTEQTCGFTVNENKAIQMFNLSSLHSSFVVSAPSDL